MLVTTGKQHLGNVRANTHSQRALIEEKPLTSDIGGAILASCRLCQLPLVCYGGSYDGATATQTSRVDEIDSNIAAVRGCGSVTCKVD